MASETAVAPGKGKTRWFLDLYIDGLKVVGRIHQLTVADEERTPGTVRQQGKWQATGMKVSWCDTDLGQYGKVLDAKKAIEEWHSGLTARKVEAQKAKLPCAAHANFRPGCVMCEKANK